MVETECVFARVVPQVPTKFPSFDHERSRGNENFPSTTITEVRELTKVVKSCSGKSTRPVQRQVQEILTGWNNVSSTDTHEKLAGELKMFPDPVQHRQHVHFELFHDSVPQGDNSVSGHV